MASKTYHIDGIGEVTIYKRRGTRRMNLRMAGAIVKVSQPLWLPYAAGVQFAQSNRNWIEQQRVKRPVQLIDEAMQVGKSRILRYEPDATLRTRITANELIIYLPAHLSINSPEVQKIAKTAIKRALKKEADAQLPERLAYCASKYGFSYTSVRCKSMRSRWGSCNNNQEITLNIFLMMAPWELIDYVLIHELAHTKHLHHGADFWDEVARIMPDYKQRRKALKDVQNTIAHLQA